MEYHISHILYATSPSGQVDFQRLADDEITYILDVSLSSVKRWQRRRRKLNNYDNDLSCLARKKGSGRKSTLTDNEKQRFKEIILGDAVEAGYPSGRWTSRNVTDLIHREFNGRNDVTQCQTYLADACLSVQNFLEREHPGWFFFEYFPAYSPELNPVEQCWQWMKNVFLVNFVVKNNPELHAKTLEAANYLNADPKLLPSFFHHAKLRF